MCNFLSNTIGNTTKELCLSAEHWGLSAEYCASVYAKITSGCMENYLFSRMNWAKQCAHGIKFCCSACCIWHQKWNICQWTSIMWVFAWSIEVPFTRTTGASAAGGYKICNSDIPQGFQVTSHSDLYSHQVFYAAYIKGSMYIAAKGNSLVAVHIVLIFDAYKLRIGVTLQYCHSAVL